MAEGQVQRHQGRQGCHKLHIDDAFAGGATRDVGCWQEDRAAREELAKEPVRSSIVRAVHAASGLMSNQLCRVARQLVLRFVSLTHALSAFTFFSG